ncbi:MAG: hypothetical protein IBX64_03415 [Actinobacteria bacterium]|nr:hypothetical protein [Actinomycetota bacterium]
MSVKDDIKNLLENKEFDKLIRLAVQEKAVARHLISFLYSENELLHWRAVDGLGIIAKDQAILSPEKVRAIISRLFLNLEDKSGGNGLGSLEAIGAIIAARLNQLSDHIPKLFSYISDAGLRKGLLWSVRRIGEQQPDLLKDWVFHVVGLLRNPSNTTRGHAAWSLGAIGDTNIRVFEGLIVDINETLEGLLNDKNHIRIYDKGELREATVGELAKESLAALKRAAKKR